MSDLRKAVRHLAKSPGFSRVSHRERAQQKVVDEAEDCRVLTPIDRPTYAGVAAVLSVVALLGTTAPAASILLSR